MKILLWFFGFVIVCRSQNRGSQNRDCYCNCYSPWQNEVINKLNFIGNWIQSTNSTLNRILNEEYLRSRECEFTNDLDMFNMTMKKLDKINREMCKNTKLAGDELEKKCVEGWKENNPDYDTSMGERSKPNGINLQDLESNLKLNVKEESELIKRLIEKKQIDLIKTMNEIVIEHVSHSVTDGINNIIFKITEELKMVKTDISDLRGLHENEKEIRKEEFAKSEQFNKKLFERNSQMKEKLAKMEKTVERIEFKSEIAFEEDFERDVSGNYSNKWIQIYSDLTKTNNNNSETPYVIYEDFKVNRIKSTFNSGNSYLSESIQNMYATFPPFSFKGKSLIFQYILKSYEVNDKRRTSFSFYDCESRFKTNTTTGNPLFQFNYGRGEIVLYNYNEDTYLTNDGISKSKKGFAFNENQEKRNDSSGHTHVIKLAIDQDGKQFEFLIDNVVKKNLFLRDPFFPKESLYCGMIFWTYNKVEIDNILLTTSKTYANLRMD